MLSQKEQVTGVKGSKRQCYTNGMGTLDETIHYWDAPHAYTYEVRNFMMPITDHLALMHVAPNGEGGTVMTWHQCFNLKGMPCATFSRQ